MERAQKTVEKASLTFPVGYGLDVEDITKRTGAFYDEKGKYFHATGFLIGPDGKIVTAVYSTGPIGRFAAKNLLMIIDYYQKQK